MSLTREALQALIDDDEHGLLTPAVKPEPVTNADILANRFEDINTFIDEHGRNPDRANRDDIGEFQLGHRLQAILDNPEYSKALEHLDRHGLFASSPGELAASIDDLLTGHDPLLDGLLDDGVEQPDAVDIFTLKHVPPPSKEAPDKVARGKPCKDFDQFEQLFIDCHADLRSGRRNIVAFRNPSNNIKEGNFYVLRGVIVYVAELGELTSKPQRQDSRLRVIYENGTESDLLRHSLGRNLYDEGKIVTEPIDSYTETFATPDHVATGTVYIARSHSADPELAKFEHLHKIGYTGGEAKDRVANAVNEPTFLHQPASLALALDMPAEYAKFIETALHQFFSAVRLDLWFEDGAEPREWFNVPVDAIEQAVELIQSGQLANYRYNAGTATIELS